MKKTLLFLPVLFLLSATLFGQGDDTPTGLAGSFGGTIQTGAGSFDPYERNASRSVTDIVVPGAVVPFTYTRIWNSRRVGWVYNWFWTIQQEVYLGDLPSGSVQNDRFSGYIVAFPDGRTISFNKPTSPAHAGSTTPGTYTAQPGVVETLVVQSNGTTAQLTLADGSVILFAVRSNISPAPSRASSVTNPHGQTVTIGGDDTGATIITEPAGRWIKISYPVLTGNTNTTTVTTSLGQSLTDSRTVNVSGYYPYAPGGSGTFSGPASTPNPNPPPYDGNAAADAAAVITSTGKVVYNDVIDPATGQPVQANYVYKNVQPPATIPNVPPPTAFDRLIWAFDPLFNGPLQQVKYIYVDGSGYSSGDNYLTAVLEEAWAASATSSFVVVNHVEMEPNTWGNAGPTEGYWDRIQTRGDGATRTISYFNPTKPYSYIQNGGVKQGFGAGQMLVDHFTDFTNNLSHIETDQYDWTHYFQTPISITDTLNHTTTQTLEATLGKITQEKHPDGSYQNWTYTTPAYYVATKTDENGNVTTFTRDPTTHLVTRIDYPGGTYETFTYNSFCQCTDHRLASGAHEKATYDPRGLKTSSTDTVTNETTTYTYDSWDRLQTVQDARAAALGLAYSEKYEYNGRNQITAIHYPATGGSADPKVSYGYDGRGRCTSITDELGNTSTMIYDDYSRIISYTEPLNAVSWNGTGTVANRNWIWTYERGRNGVTYAANTHVSKNWRKQVEPAYDANGDRRMTVREYDVNDRLVTEQTGWVVQPNGANVYGSDGETHSFAYDTEGNKNQYTDPLSRITTYAYDTRNRLTTTTEPLSRVTTNTLDAVGNKTKVTFPDTKTQQWGGYDAFGQPATFTDELSNITNLAYQWGPMKKLFTVTTHRDTDTGGTENQLTTFIYDGLGRATQTTFPDTTTEATTYQYGDVKTWKTRKGPTKTIAYDARGRETSHTWNDGGVTPEIDQTWDDANRITTLANVFSTIGFSYDSAGQVITESNKVAGSSGPAALSYARYPDGMPSLLTYPNGFGLRRDYTARGQLDITGSADASGNYITQFVNYAYLADGKVSSETYGNGVITSYAYDGRGFVNNIKTSVGSSGPIYTNRTYYRDTRDRITAWVKSNSSAANPLENARGDAYTYDAEGQLTAASYEAKTPNTTPKTPQRTESFIFDAMGNRKGVNQLDGRGSVTFSRKNTGVNEYSSWTPSSISYDTNGSLTAEGWISASYNALNQPVYITSPSPSIPPGDSVYFGYDPLGRPVKRWYAPTGAGSATDNPATYLYYEGWDLIAEGSDSAAISRIYAHGNRIDEIVADSNDAGTTWAYHHFDARSHCIMLTNASGNLLEQYDYDAFGKAYYYDANGNALTTSSWGNRFLFTGREWLSDLGVYDFRHRLYHAELGRFVQPDPKEFLAGDYNIYRYCHNDPVNKVDPAGLLTISFGVEETHTDSLIPRLVTYTVNFTTSGNHKNADPEAHKTDADLRNPKDNSRTAGLTVPTVGVFTPSKGSHVLTANLNIDWYVRRAAADRDPELAKLEVQHTPLLLAFWDKEAQKYKTTWNIFGGWAAAKVLASFLEGDLDIEKAWEVGTLDCRTCPHNYKKPY